MTNAIGLVNTVTRVIEVQPPSNLGVFVNEISYAARWNNGKGGKDTLSFTANVFLGDAVVGASTPVAVDIAGAHFAGTLNAKLMDKTNPAVKWKIAQTKKRPAGAVTLSLKVTKATLAAAFQQAGAIAPSAPHVTVTVPIPVRIVVGERSFATGVLSNFNFLGDGKRAIGNGVGPR